jgi:hypothetical protein
MFPETVKTPSSDPSQIKRSGTKSTDTRNPLGELVQFLEHLGMAGLALERNTSGQNAITQGLASGDPQALVIVEGPTASLSPIEVIGDWIIDNASNQAPFPFQRNRDRQMRNGVDEIGRAIDGVDNPAIGLVGAFDHAALFTQKAIAGARFAQLFKQDFFSLEISSGYKIGRALFCQLQIFNFTEISADGFASIARARSGATSQRLMRCGVAF